MCESDISFAISKSQSAESLSQKEAILETSELPKSNVSQNEILNLRKRNSEDIVGNMTSKEKVVDIENKDLIEPITYCDFDQDKPLLLKDFEQVTK